MSALVFVIFFAAVVVVVRLNFCQHQLNFSSLSKRVKCYQRKLKFEPRETETEKSIFEILSKIKLTLFCRSSSFQIIVHYNNDLFKRKMLNSLTAGHSGNSIHLTIVGSNLTPEMLMNTAQNML